MSELDRFKTIGGANGRVCKGCGRVEVNCECSKLITRDDMKAEDSVQKKILDEVSTILREGGKTYELIPKIRKALSKDPCHQSQLQALKEEVVALKDKDLDRLETVDETRDI